MRAVKAYGEMEIKLHSCLTSVLGGGERPALSCGRFALGKGPFSVPRCPLQRRLVGSEAGCRTAERIVVKFSIGKFRAHCRGILV